MHTSFLVSKTATLVAFAASACIFSPAAIAHDPPRRSDADPFVGTWLHDAARVDCASGTVLVRFQAMQMIHRGGTLSDTNTQPPASRGPGFGLWERVGKGRYEVRFRFARYFPDGNLDGYTVVRGTTLLADDDRSATNVSRVEILDAGDHLVATACARTTATRFQ
jgi:hypothetical protein